MQSRREFLKSTIGVAGAAYLPASSWRAVRGANDDIRLAVVGFHSRGQAHIEEFSKIPGVRIVALCDCDRNVLDAGIAKLDKAGIKATGYQDVRKLLESREIDAISTATPNHWHSLITVWGCQAGKDVYVEKPVSHNVFEGRKAVEAARLYNRIVQAGTQSRSDAKLHEAFEWLREGHLGSVKVARGLCYKPRTSIGLVGGATPVPDGLDYDLWCGPAAKTQIMRRSLHYDWHWVWNTGNGDIGNQGVHQIDIARWALGRRDLPSSVFSIGGRLGYVDDGETANTQMVVMKYGDALLVFEVRGLPSKTGGRSMDRYRGQDIGHVIECEGGYIAGTVAYDNAGKEIRRFTGEGRQMEGHFANFITAVRSRKRSDLKADILEGHLSSALCHLGNISYRRGLATPEDRVRDSVKADTVASETLARMEEHLAANGVDLAKSRLTLGPTLRFDASAEKFLDDTEANSLLTRPYRRGFVVPEIV